MMLQSPRGLLPYLFPAKQPYNRHHIPLPSSNPLCKPLGRALGMRGSMQSCDNP